EGTLVNEGLIRQETGTALTVTTGTGQLINESTMEAAGTGKLIFTNARIENEGGLIRALDTRVVQVGPTALISNGTLSGEDTGSIEFASSNSTSGINVPVLENVVLEGLVSQPNVSSVAIRGTITNNAVWTNNHISGNSSDILAQNGAVLDGTGSIVMT